VQSQLGRPRVRGIQERRRSQSTSTAPTTHETSSRGDCSSTSSGAISTSPARTSVATRPVAGSARSSSTVPR
jgi:hypothetical protein